MKLSNRLKHCYELLVDEYAALLKALSSTKYSLVDAALKQLGQHPVTFAGLKSVDGKQVPEETYLHHEHDMGSSQCLDYIFEVNFAGGHQTQAVRNLKVQKFEVEN